MKILFATDLHGQKLKYEKVLRIAQEQKVDAVINGGDMLPKENLFAQDKFIVNFLDCHFAQYNAAKIYYLGLLGNDDLRIFDRLFQQTCDKYPFIFNLAQKKIELGGYEFIGMNYVADYPFQLKDRCRKDFSDFLFPVQLGQGLLSAPDGWEKIANWFLYAETLPTLEEELNKLPAPKDMKKAIYVLHMPPSNLGLDVCLDRRHVGSQAVYGFLEKNQPLFSLHGHIHESPMVSGKWWANLNKTICIQPGQYGYFDPIDLISCVFIDLEKKEVKRIG